MAIGFAAAEICQRRDILKKKHVYPLFGWEVTYLTYFQLKVFLAVCTNSFSLISRTFQERQERSRIVAARSGA